MKEKIKKRRLLLGRLRPETRPRFLAYEKRDAILRELGFGSYQQYLKTELWIEIRKAVLERDKHQCHVCGKLARQVHHEAYTAATLLGEANHNLHAICCGCHRSIEFAGASKLPMRIANKRMRRWRRKRAKNNCWEGNREYRGLWMERKRLRTSPRPHSDEVKARIKELSKKIKSLVQSMETSL